MSSDDCNECGRDDGTHQSFCSEQGGGAFGRKLDLSNVGADGYHPPQPEKECNPTDGHTDACKLRMTTHTGRSCSKAPNVSRSMRMESAILRASEGLAAFHLHGELRAVSREANEHAEARASLVDEVAALKRELQAVRVLDAWAKKHGGAWRTSEDKDPAPDAAECRTILYGWGGGYTDSSAFAATAAAARIAAADALLKEDPSLGSEV